ncbi:MFS transporter [Amycolatopsis sp. FDAARGOS 1241]|uniref:MFS transporter n=1 Tax=Amycolatopsis sp. FDAARGOS 1241 TaxID=2778070 RepID=UPI0019528BBE|nr:MFS transporter [Amycolatopsis sp. FDAARGOS 1241]
MLFYAFGALLAVFAVNLPMLIAGFVIIGLAVGADVPASPALVAELAPPKARGKLVGLTQVAWSLGPIVVLLPAFVLSPLGPRGTRIVFADLVVIALVTWYLRRGSWSRCAGESGGGQSGQGADVSCCGPVPRPQPQGAAVHRRGLHPRELGGRHEGLLPARHPQHGRRAEPGHKSHPPVRHLHRDTRRDLPRVHSHVQEATAGRR